MYFLWLFLGVFLWEAIFLGAHKLLVLINFLFIFFSCLYILPKVIFPGVGFPCFFAVVVVVVVFLRG